MPKQLYVKDDFGKLRVIEEKDDAYCIHGIELTKDCADCGEDVDANSEADELVLSY
jgi:hypothetical protein